MADDAEDRVELTELDVITRWSLAVRSATAPRADLIKALKADLGWLEAGRPGRRTPRHAPTAAQPPPPAAAKKVPAKRANAKKAPASKAPAAAKQAGRQAR